MRNNAVHQSCTACVVECESVKFVELWVANEPSAKGSDHGEGWGHRTPHTSISRNFTLNVPVTIIRPCCSCVLLISLRPNQCVTADRVRKPDCDLELNTRRSLCILKSCICKCAANRGKHIQHQNQLLSFSGKKKTAFIHLTQLSRVSGFFFFFFCECIPRQEMHAWELNSVSVRFKVFHVMEQVAASTLYAMTQTTASLKAKLPCDGISELLTALMISFCLFFLLCFSKEVNSIFRSTRQRDLSL